MRLEERLEYAETNKTGSALLWSQWRFDRELMTRSLNAISTFFPHYSLHDSTHSKSIILEIEKILGSNIEKLSFVDVWLLLEAAYWHDIGMVIPFEEKKKILDGDEFKKFLSEIASISSDLSSHAKMVISHLESGPYIDYLDLELAYLFTIAEFIRIKHSERSKQNLIEPDSLSIPSPRTGLINGRLFKILGDIIDCHGKDFVSILELPFMNDGLELYDIAHPRLIACLLRLGDLLDLDDGRHCPTQLKIVGNLPDISLAHLEKNRSIISKCVNESNIEIKAKCENFDAFEVQNDWFSYIEKEIENQDKYWGEISPIDYVPKPPTVKALSCELSGSVSLGRRASRMVLDTDRVYEFLQGKHIYEKPLSCLAELLQNSVDATIDRIWLECIRNISDRTEFKRIAENHRIDVCIEKNKLPNKKIKYIVTISDSGKGMNLEEIKSILTVASSANQIRKEKIRFGMPEWLKPSGFFGIGLQSVFSITDQISISTRAPGDSFYEIIIKSSPRRTPSFVVKKFNRDDWNFGTKVSFSLLEAAIPDSIRGGKSVMEALSTFDPLKDEMLNVTETRIEEQVSKFAKHCQFPLYFNDRKLQNELDKFDIFDDENGIEYSLEFYLDGGHCNCYYRGRSVNSGLFFPLFNIKCNILSERVDKFLSLSRAHMHSEGIKLFKQKIEKSLRKMKQKILEVVINKEVAQLYYHLDGEEHDNSWKNIQLSGHKLSNLVNLGAKIAITFDLLNEEQLQNPSFEIPFLYQHCFTKILVLILQKHNFGVIIHDIASHPVKDTFKRRENKKASVYTFEIVDLPSKSRIEQSAIKYLSDSKLSRERKRYWLPCGEEQFQDLSLPVSCMDEYPWVQPLTNFYRFFTRGIILRSTATELEEDIRNLIDAVKKSKPSLSASLIETAIRDFYKIYTFEAEEYDFNRFSLFE